MLEVNLADMRQYVESLNYRPLFVTVSGAHLYGFPSSDSDVDLRGCHLSPLREMVGLDLPKLTLERKTELNGTEVELVSHEIGKYLRLLVRNNGYILEQIFSPIVVIGQEFLNELPRWPADASPDTTITIIGVSTQRNVSCWPRRNPSEPNRCCTPTDY